MTKFNKAQGKKLLIILLFVAVFSARLTATADIENGKKLYEANNCGSCHAIDKKIIGPALAGVNKRHSEEWLVQWIRNNKKLRESGDAEALKLFSEYNNSPMNIYENLAVQDIKDILSYINSQENNHQIDINAQSNQESDQEKSSISYLIFLVVVFFVLFLVLTRVRSRLRKMTPNEDSENR